MPKRPDLREFVLVKNIMTSTESAEGGVTTANGGVAVKSAAGQPAVGETNGHSGDLEPTQPKRSKEGTPDADGYFSSYNDIEVHKLMLQDRPRTEAYQNAILENSHLFKGKTVLDIGAGTGILSLFSMKAGASKVYAVEASPMVGLLREIVELNNENGVVEVIHGKAEDIKLPDQVDIIVSEWMGFYLLHESMLDSVIKARDIHLNDDGIMFPSHATIHAAPIQLNSYIKDNIDYWDNVYGFNMNPVAQHVMENKMSGGAPEVMVVGAEELLAAPVTITEYDLRWVQLDEVTAVKDKKFVSINKQGSFHGLCVWFQADFNPLFYDDDVAEQFRRVKLDTGPSAPATHWKQTVIVIPSADSEVDIDEVIGWELSMVQSQENPRHYELGLSLLDPELDEHPIPCRCQMGRCALFAALMEKEDEELQDLEEIGEDQKIEENAGADDS